MTESAATASRIAGLDITRGFAVMGILAMNIVAFALPEAAYIHPRAWGDGSAADIASWAASFLLVDGKMRGLFSLLFGASTLLVIESAEGAGRSPARIHYARMVTLLIFGFLHFAFIWHGDILFLYAACGMLLYAMRGQSVKTLWLLGALTIGIQTLAYGGLFLLLKTPALASALTDMIGQFAPRSPESLKEVTLYLGSYAGIVQHRLTTDLATPFASVPAFGFETIGIMLIGMAMLRNGMLRGDWDLARLARWRNIGLGVGLTGNSALLAMQLASGLDPWLVLTSELACSAPFDIAMNVGYAALFMGLAQQFADSGLIARVGAAGRMAFSNYIGTSIVMTTIFYGYGGALFGDVPRSALWGFVVAMWAVMLIWSKPWLDRYRYGPLEWVWRSLARWRWEPMGR
jgi:uncharacterized protein